MSFRRLLVFVAAGLLAASCEKLNLDDYIAGGDADGDAVEEPQEGLWVTLRVANLDVADYGGGSTFAAAKRRAASSVGELGDRINVAVYQGGSRVKTVNQQATADAFGMVQFELDDEGTYEILLLLHSCDGNATTTSVDGVKFPSNKVTDTFWFYTNNVDVYYADSLETLVNIELDADVSRRVAMYRFTIEGEIPDDVAQMKFYYTGGSSTLDGTTGYGCVNSRQTEYRDVVSHEAGQTFELFTFPHEDTDELKMTITALDSGGNDLHEVVYTNVPVEMNMITSHSADYFGDVGSKAAGNFELIDF
ncbi:MAG: FimB/Mfa2 family fimbrial subunit [Prevotella sp.]|nr:FimB/Mfa2 family fimbrial subunit [Prevotella sp.]